MFKNNIRLVILALFAVLVTTLATIAQPWQNVDPASSGWPIEKLNAAQAYSDSLNPTAVMVVHDGRVIASWGDISREVNLA